MSDAKNDTSSEFAWKVICELGQMERHFNQMENYCRTLASSWLLATFGGMGFLLSQRLNTSIPAEVLIIGIALASSVGLLLLWVLDLLVYHRLLDACFSEAMRVEKENPIIPGVRMHMVKSQPKGEVTHRVMLFYVGTVNAPLLFGGVLLCIWCAKYGWAAAGGVLGSLLCVMAVLTLLIYKQSPSLGRRDAATGANQK